MGINSPLTLREAEILTWVANGKTAVEISQIIGISKHSVTSHMSHAKEKAEVFKDTQLVAIAVRKGWID